MRSSLCKFFSCYETQQLILGTGIAIWWLTEPHWLFIKILCFDVQKCNFLNGADKLWHWTGAKIKFFLLKKYSVCHCRCTLYKLTYVSSKAALFHSQFANKLIMLVGCKHPGSFFSKSDEEKPKSLTKIPPWQSFRPAKCIVQPGIDVMNFFFFVIYSGGKYDIVYLRNVFPD